MDDLKFNKSAAGFLMAGLIALGGYKIAEILVPHQELAENSYPIQITEQVASSSTGTAPVGPEPILAMLADADIAAGQKVAKKCTACHVFDKGGQNKVGPALWNIINTGKGQIDGYAYSEALAGFGGKWDYQSLNQFFYKPKAYISGTKMNFAGLKKPADRANLIAYLRGQADQPAALPTSDEIAAEAQ